MTAPAMVPSTKGAPYAHRLVRERKADAPVSRRTIRNPQEAASYARAFLDAEPVEVLGVVLLDVQHRPIGWCEVTRGLLDSSLVHPREVFARAIVGMAASIIVVHNHPSGDPTPSADDRVVTSQLVAAGTLLGIPVRDHVIIGDADETARGGGRFYSFAEAGMLR